MITNNDLRSGVKPRISCLGFAPRFFLTLIAAVGFTVLPGLTQAGTPDLSEPTAASAYAWQLFIEAVSPQSGTNQSLTFESWMEQCDIQPALCPDAQKKDAANSAAVGKGKVRHAHGSALGRKLGAANANPDGKISCEAMNHAALTKLAPNNVQKGAVFCEEVFVNSVESNFIIDNGLTTINGQQKYGNVTFPSGSVEIKVDWVPASSFKTVPFNSASCTNNTNTPNSLYLEMIQFSGDSSPQCYAMAGMHISSKVLPNWLWATFEPNNGLTNPYRCNPKLYSQCFDPFGTNSAAPYGPADIKNVQQSVTLAGLMKAANLAPAFNNYYLTGVQTQFVQDGKTPIPLGNSFIEFNAKVKPGQSSCITCHNYAYAGTTNIGFPLHKWPSIGYACKLSSVTDNPTSSCLPPKGKNWTSEDFSWLLGIMPQGAQPGKSKQSKVKH